MDKTKAIDVFSWRMDIPFDVAAYCRGHKFSVEAVALNQAIRLVEQKENDVTQAERAAEAALANLKACIENVKQKMEVKSP